MKILFVGDIYGSDGRRAASEIIKPLREEYGIDLCIANGENTAGGRGLTRNLLGKLRSYGVDVVTSGNHIWDNRDIIYEFDNNPDCRVIRPANYPEGNPGKGSYIFTGIDETKAGVMNLQGRVYMFPIDCPFRKADKLIEQIKKKTPIIIADFHAEATSEKIALGHYLDGRVTAVLGTHTHVMTDDACILPNGTAYITDAGMTGSRNSVIGVKKDIIIRKFLYESPVKYEPASGDTIFCGVIIEADPETGKALDIQKISIEC
ncbi:MAG: TIGR00282 family metallophosphoesterase [Fibrobacterota bacterium]